jgi:ribose/xylose/arabinose/galactoside ABC-type transport system permease subunit
VLFVGTIFNGFTLMDVPYHLQLVVQGTILIAAVTSAGLWQGLLQSMRLRTAWQGTWGRGEDAGDAH